jgi:hypothetical protein
MPPAGKKEHPCPRNLCAGMGSFLRMFKNEGLQSRRQFEIEKKIMFVEYLSNLSNAGALRAPALL